MTAIMFSIYEVKYAFKTHATQLSLKPGYKVKILKHIAPIDCYEVMIVGHPHHLAINCTVTHENLMANCILQTAKPAGISSGAAIGLNAWLPTTSGHSFCDSKSSPNDILTAGDQQDFFGDYDISISDEETVKIYPIKCECGVSSIGGGNHSTWCPIKNE